MPDKNKPSQKTRQHRESKGSARGAKRVRLSDLEKILIANGGMGHRLRRPSRDTYAGTQSRRSKTAKRSQKQEQAA